MKYISLMSKLLNFGICSMYFGGAGLLKCSCFYYLWWDLGSLGVFGVSQHLTPLPRRPSRGWSSPDLRPSCSPRVSPLHPQPPGGLFCGLTCRSNVPLFQSPRAPLDFFFFLKISWGFYISIRFRCDYRHWRYQLRLWQSGFMHRVETWWHNKHNPVPGATGPYGVAWAALIVVTGKSSLKLNVLVLLVLLGTMRDREIWNRSWTPTQLWLTQRYQSHRYQLNVQSQN